MRLLKLRCLRGINALCRAAIICGLVLFYSAGWAAEKVEYKDIYLSQNRVCKACRLEWVNSAQVRLINQAGQASMVPARSVLGVDRHPVIRKALIHSLFGIGLPGPVLVPEAFPDGNDYVCKYCMYFNRYSTWPD